jgi:hypothetical protein
MCVEVNEPGSDDQSRGIEEFASVWGKLTGLRDFNNLLAIQQQVHRRIHIPGWINNAPVLNEKHAMGPLYL